MRPGMVAIIADGPRVRRSRGARSRRALGSFGLPSVRHVASAARTPGYVLQLVTQIDATFARALIVTVGSGDGALANMIEFASATPVVRAPATADIHLIALQCAKAFALEDTVVFGRVLLVEANARSTRSASGCDAEPTAAGVSGDLASDTERLIAERKRIGVALSPDEVRSIVAHLGRIPTDTELFAFDAQWSEHCSYKSSRHFLRRLPVEGPTVMQGPAEDAGILYLGRWDGERYGIVIAHESHNHPSQVVPFEGAATGVGGIVRDVLCMGAEVIGIADPLRFGRLEDPHCRYVAQSVVDGIAAYGNAIGVPNLGGDVYIDESFDDNVLVNVVALGLIKETRDHPLVRAAELDRLRHRAGRKSDGPQRLRRRLVFVADARRRGCRSEQGRRSSSRSVSQERDHARVLSGVRRSAQARHRGRLQGPRRRRLRRLQRGVVRARAASARRSNSIASRFRRPICRRR